jgi:hypothetical protein
MESIFKYFLYKEEKSRNLVFILFALLLEVNHNIILRINKCLQNWMTKKFVDSIYM